MADPTGIVNDCVGRHVGYVESTLGRHVGYLIHYKRNLKDLRTQVGELNVDKDTTWERVRAAEAKGEMIHRNVQDWLEKVDEITEMAEKILKGKRQSSQPKMKCVQGFCPNPLLRRRRSKESLEFKDEVIELINEGRQLSNISYSVQAKDVCLESGQDYLEFNSRASTVEKIMDELRSPNSADIILVHGIGGVGKTTLAEEVLRRAAKEKLFDDSVMVLDVKKVKKPNLEAIQKVIAEKLGLDIAKIETKEERADKICARIKGKKTGDESKQEKKTLVILDDVWEEIDLKAVGLPPIKTCRILLTSRTSKLFCAERINQKPFQLGVLGEVETWLLFEKTAGNVVEGDHIRTIATKLAKKCGGLPVLVVTVASSLRNEARLPIWRDALSSLERFDKEEELTEKAYLVLEWSYEQLNKNLKPLFLLCGTIVEGNSISLTNLFKYSMGLGFFKKTKTVKEARDALDAQVRKLKASNLLLDGDDDTCVRMHELVHLVVNQIASRDHHVLVQDGADDKLKEWEKEDLFRCSKISLPSCNITTLPQVPWECPKLEMFHLHSKGEDDDEDEDNDDDENEDDDSSRDMPINFFEEMKNLKVLGLNNLPPISLPQSLKCLKNLQTLCLDGCMFEDITIVGELRNLQILSIVKSKVKQLPKEIGQLTGLRLLDLCDCSLLKVISPGVISNLTRLEDLRMRNSFDKWEGEGVICETSNASLLELMNLSELTAIEIRIPDANILPPNLFSNKLERYQICVGDARKWNCMYETTLNTLKLQLTTSNELDRGLNMLLEKCDVLCLDGMKGFDFAYIINMKVMLPYLSSLVVHRCNSLRFMLSSSMARSLRKLKHLEITECQMMEEIVSTKKYDEEITGIMFPHLQHLKLKDLPNLARLCSGSYIELSALKTLKVVECAKLKKFIFDPLNKRIAIYKELEGGDLKEKLQTVVQHFIFDVEKVVLPNLTSLIIHRLDGLSFLLSSSMARSVVQFRYREISKCQIMELIVSARGYGEENSDDMFSKLELLEQNDLHSLDKFGSIQRWNMVECIKLETVFDPVSENISIYKEMKETHSEENLDSVVHSFLFDEKIVLRNITRLIIHRCHGLSLLLSSDMAKTLVQLKHVEISECQIMKEIVFLEECSEANIDDMLPKLEQLVLKDLPNLTRFCSGSYIEFPSLERLHLEKCRKLETFIFYPLRKSIAIDKEIEERDTEENLEMVVPYFLFDKKVRFPKLERLTINYLPKLTKIWGSQLSENSFCKLRDVTVQQCNSLINIVPDSIARDFQHLQKLTVETCGVLEEIVAQEEGETLMPDQFVLFPKVTCLEFRSLPQLKRFYPRNHALNWQLLKTLELFHCRIVDIFASGFSGLPKTPDFSGLRNPVKQPFVLIEKSSFPNLEDLTLGPMDIGYDPPAPVAFYKQAVFPGISSRHTDLKRLRLHGIEKRMRLWEENTKPLGPVFLQLKTLEVKFCGLKNQKLSAISFKNLTSLEVSFCWRLQYLTTYSVAQSLGQLEKLKVDECKSMKEILANDGVGEDASNREIDFKQLRHLELSDLISLERFCSRNCTVKIPLLETSALVVNWCSLKLKISSNRTLEEVDSKMHLNVQKSQSRKEAAGATTEATGSLETNQKQPTPNASEGAQDIESEHGAVNQETTINSQNMEHAADKVTNTSKNLQEADSVIAYLRVSKLEGEIRHLQEELRNKEQKLADERLATVDPSLQEVN